MTRPTAEARLEWTPIGVDTSDLTLTFTEQQGADVRGPDALEWSLEPVAEMELIFAPSGIYEAQVFSVYEQLSIALEGIDEARQPWLLGRLFEFAQHVAGGGRFRAMLYRNHSKLLTSGSHLAADSSITVTTDPTTAPNKWGDDLDPIFLPVRIYDPANPDSVTYNVCNLVTDVPAQVILHKNVDQDLPASSVIEPMDNLGEQGGSTEPCVCLNAGRVLQRRRAGQSRGLWDFRLLARTVGTA